MFLQIKKKFQKIFLFQLEDEFKKLKVSGLCLEFYSFNGQ